MDWHIVAWVAGVWVLFVLVEIWRRRAQPTIRKRINDAADRRNAYALAREADAAFDRMKQLEDSNAELRRELAERDAKPKYMDDRLD